MKIVEPKNKLQLILLTQYPKLVTQNYIHFVQNSIKAILQHIKKVVVIL